MSEKPKILIVNNNMQVGGIQKSLLNLLNGIKDQYDIELLLFSEYGELYKEIPSGVKVIFASKPFRILGTPWAEIKNNPIMALYKLIILLINKIFGKDTAFKIVSMFQKEICGYTHAISFSHCTNEKSFSVCTPEFVLRCVKAERKICYIHCDYSNSDTASKHNNDIYRQFDKIACCSESVRKRFLKLVPDIEDKTFVVRNFYDMSIISKANNDPVTYDDKFINIISASRLSEEKGIFRAIKAIFEANCKSIRYYIVGDGPQKNDIKQYIDNNRMGGQICLLGEQTNPYRFMKNADYLLVPSYHEAAPMVFDEARILGLRVISTPTTSAEEMLDSQKDIICDTFDVTLFKSLSKSDFKISSVVSNKKREEEFYSLVKEVQDERGII